MNTIETFWYYLNNKDILQVNFMLQNVFLSWSKVTFIIGCIITYIMFRLIIKLMRYQAFLELKNSVDNFNKKYKNKN